jgi:DNA-directed RNA polymerase specialized sigma24 family protein
MDPNKAASDLQDDLTLRLWDGDESVKGELVMQFVPAVSAAIAGAFESLSEHDVEEVMSEAISRFWRWRNRYDPATGSIRACLYKIAVRVASEMLSGRLNWQKARLLERHLSDESAFDLAAKDAIEEDLDKLESLNPDLLKALKEASGGLPPLQQDILEAYAKAWANDYELDAGRLGIELGRKHNHGVPYPAVTIRGYKHRAKEALAVAMKKRGFDLRGLGYIHD